MKAKSVPVVGALLLLAISVVQAQETAAQRQEMATNQLKRLAAEMSARCLSDVPSLADWQQRRPELKRQLLEMLGLDPLPKRTPLRAEVTGQVAGPDYRIEKVVFQSLPGLYVTGNFYLPNNSRGRLPTVLYLCGHSPHPLGAKFQYQDRSAWYAAHGFACLILDTLEFGEVAGVHHGTHDLNLWSWLSLGYTPAGTEVWNAIRALDYLESRPEVDAKRIGLTGISGGGAMTWYVAAVDERIRAAAPVCSTFTFGSQADHWLARGQCDCIYYHNTYLWDFPVVGALIAPRPLLILSGQKDSIFPPDGYHAAFQKAKKIYDLYASPTVAADAIRELDDNVEHSDAPLLRTEAHQWMQRWLKGDSTPLTEEKEAPRKESAESLACLARLPADAINYRIQDQLTVRATPKTPSSQPAWERRRAALIAELRTKVFRWFPTGRIPFETQASKNSGGWLARYDYADTREVSFQSEDGVRIRVQHFAPKEASADTPLLLYVKRPGDSFNSSDVDELLPLMGRFHVLVLHPRFSESPLNAADYADVERTAVWVGRTVAAMQVWDVMRGVQWAVEEEKLPARAVTIYGKGTMGIIALYAALFDERIQQVILNDPPSSHKQAPALLNVLRVTDIPEAAGALAPRKLISLTALPEAFDRTREVFRVQRASGQMIQSGSLPEALEVWKHPAPRTAP